MALIREFTHQPQASASFRTEVECGWTVADVGNRRILHLETYGSKSRQIPGKVSQSIELDDRSAAELHHLLEQAFPSLRSGKDDPS